MIDWWQGLTAAEQVFAGMGLGFGAILFGLLGLSIVGADLDADVDGDFDGDIDASGAFSVKGVLSFLTFFGAGGFLALTYGFPLWGAGVTALIFGYAVMSTLVWMLAKLRGLDADHNRRDEALLGQEGRVYLKIPAGGAGVGRVEVLQGGRLVEVEAETRGTAIATGAAVQVLDVLSPGRVLVAPLSELPAASH